jgi:hypothetical protein
MSPSPTLLIVAKAPVAGFAKTRIGAEQGHDRAAEVAAAALLDTLETATTAGWPVVVALTGELGDAARSTEIARALEATRVVAQRGNTFGERLAHAHLDADAGHGVVQVGMDTPQVTVDDYLAAGRALQDGASVLGPATDGGWWLLGLRDGRDAHVLTDVPMSRLDTGELTVQALANLHPHHDVPLLRPLTDLDTWADVLAVAAELPGSHLARALAQVAA